METERTPNEITIHDDYIEIKKFGGIIHPYVKYAYGFIYKYIIKPLKLEISREFWYFLSFGILTTILFFSTIPFWLPLLFFSLAGLEVLLMNGGFFKEKFLPSPNRDVEKFFTEIDQRRQYDAIKFISDNNLGTRTLIRILSIPKFKENAQIYSYVVKKQWIQPELLNFIIENNLYVQMGDDIFCEFIKNSISNMSRANYLKISQVFAKNIKVIRTINYCYQDFLKNHDIFKFFAKIPLKIKDSFIFGYGNLILFSIFFIMYLYLFGTGQLQHLYVSTPNQIINLLGLFSVFISMLLASGILALILRTIILKITQTRYLLYFFTPITTEIIQ